MLIRIWNEQKEYKETNVMTEKNNSKEHLRHNEKKRNAVNVVYGFTSPTLPTTKLYRLTYPHHFLTHAKVL